MPLADETFTDLHSLFAHLGTDRRAALEFAADPPSGLTQVGLGSVTGADVAAVLDEVAFGSGVGAGLGASVTADAGTADPASPESGLAETVAQLLSALLPFHREDAVVGEAIAAAVTMVTEDPHDALGASSGTGVAALDEPNPDPPDPAAALRDIGRIVPGLGDEPSEPLRFGDDDAASQPPPVEFDQHSTDHDPETIAE